MTKPETDRRYRNYVRVLLSVAGVSLVIGLAGSLLVAFGVGSKLAIYTVMGLATVGVALWYSWRWWKAIDEAVREAHKTSWFWGGSSGLGLVAAFVLPLVTIAEGDVPQLGLTPSEAGFLLAGVAITSLMMLFGYAVFWAGWWISRGR